MNSRSLAFKVTSIWLMLAGVALLFRAWATSCLP